MKLGGFKAPPVEEPEPAVVVDERLAKWTAAWTSLRAKKLPPAEHEARRDEMFAWARERGRGELDVCLEGLLRAESYYAPVGVEDRTLFASFPFEKFVPR